MRFHLGVEKSLKISSGVKIVASISLAFTCLPGWAEIGFNKDIRPILSDKCFHCHGPDAETREANLRLDTAEGLLTDLGGYFAIVPGKPNDSEVYKRVSHADPSERMPPPEAHKIITEQEQKLLHEWIKQGAQWEGHWAFEPIGSPPLPAVQQESWPANAIDHFVLARLEKEKLAPSSRAKNETLIRRLYLDITGLPATYEQVQAYLNDTSDDAYERLVDNLLATQAYGEHQASFWLDAARYADTHGLHLDNYRSVWPYRDWVVNALNENMPYDQFTIEQLAGDLLPNPTQSQLVATGFTRASPTTSEGGAIDEEYYAIYAKDRTETMSTVWMGLTTGCAACHDHKFDPVSQKEFYQLTAFFRNTTEYAMDGNTYDTRPSISVLQGEKLTQKHNIQTLSAKLQTQLYALTQSQSHTIQQWFDTLDKPKQSLPVANDSMIFHLPANEGKGNVLQANIANESVTATLDGKFGWQTKGTSSALAINRSSLITLPKIADFGYKDAFTVSFWIKTPKDSIEEQVLLSRIDVDKGWFNWESKTAGWFVEAFNNTSVRLSLNYPKSGFIHGHLNNVLTPETWHHVTMIYDGTATQNAFEVYIDGQRQESPAVISLKNPGLYHSFEKGELSNPLTVGALQHPYAHQEDRQDEKVRHKNGKSPFVAIQDVRIYQGMLSETDTQILAQSNHIEALLNADKRDFSDDQRSLLSQYYSSQIHTEGKALERQNRDLINQLVELKKGEPVTLIMQDKKTSTPFAHVLKRGQYDVKGEKVDSGVPQVLPAMHKTGVANRLDLAKWLVSDEHPLTARVAVNRIWQSFFGKGLVETAEDFGSQGSSPSHPQLLDWLAQDFRSNGWNIKRTIKQMVMSSTYQQSSIASDEVRNTDPDNILLARAHRSRLNAEVIRDQALFVSGLLIDKAGGPPVKPYQPNGLWKAVAYVDSNTAKFVQDHGESLYRKSLYTYRKRTASPPGMALFDAPDRESCSVRREQTNTPLQALLLMNDPQFLEAARHLGEKVMRAHQEDKIDFLVWHTLGRKVDQNMKAVLTSSYTDILELYQADTQAANDLLGVGESEFDQELDNIQLATWTMLASQIFNLDEFITRN